MKTNTLFLETINGKPGNRPPMWFMRQAGRVLPSYNALKEQYTFWQLMKDPHLAAKVTLLPIEDLGVDAAILFSDILVVPYALGMGLDFTDNGPVFDKPLSEYPDPLKVFKPDAGKLDYIYNAIDEIVRTRPADVPLIGFAGAPLTVLCYMLEGLSSKNHFQTAISYIYKNKEVVTKLIDTVTEMTIHYAKEQIKHGIDTFQLFETHGGSIPFELYEEMFLPSVKKIGNAVRETQTPFIFFPKDIGTGYRKITYDICDYVSVDWQTPLAHAREIIDPRVGLQGNIDPRMLFSDLETIDKGLEAYIEFGRHHKNWIINFGHGFMPGIPFEHAKYMIDRLKAADWKR